MSAMAAVELQNAASSKALSAGCRFDAPIETKAGWVARAVRGDGVTKPQLFLGKGASPDAALLDLIEKLPEPGVPTAQHCPTCSCGPA